MRDKVKLSISIGEGWIASEAVAIDKSFIVLVTLRGHGQERQLRFDVGKGAFIDPAPLRLSSDSVHELAEALQAA